MTRLRKYFKDEESYNNLINLYKQLRKEGKIEMILFLKAIVACCLTKQMWDEKTQSFKTIGTWHTPDAYFSPHGNYPYFSEAYTMDKLKRQYVIYTKPNNRHKVFGENPRKYMHKLFNRQLPTS